MPIDGASSQAAADDTTATNLYARLNNQQTKVTLAQVESYLKANRRSAASLLGAFRTTGDTTLLDEAMQKYPHDPQVAFEAVYRKDATPEERRQWLEAFRQAAPDNAFPDYLSALDYFKAGQTDQAVQALTAAAGKQTFDDYSTERVENDEEAYLAAGYPVADAKAVAASSLLLPQLAQTKELGLKMIDLAQSYQQAGDATSAQTALQMAASLGQRYGTEVPGESEVEPTVVGLWIERAALNAMDPNASLDSSGQTVQDRLTQVNLRRTALNDLDQQASPLLPQLSDQDWIIYKDRWMNFGEDSAMR